MVILFGLCVHGPLIIGIIDINRYALWDELLGYSLEFVLLLLISPTYHQRF